MVASIGSAEMSRTVRVHHRASKELISQRSSRKSCGSPGTSTTSATLVALALALVCLASQAHPAAGYGSQITPSFELEMIFPRAMLLVDDVGDCKLARRGRALLATNNNTSNYRPLAERGNRIDPLDSFNKYRGGYDLKNKHYWASVIFTGIYGYAIAVAWLALGFLILFFICCKCLCGRRPHSLRPHSRAYYWTPRVIVFLLSAIAIGSSVVVFIAGRELNRQAYNVEDVLVAAAQNATDSIHNVSSTLGSVQTMVMPYSGSLAAALNSTETKLDSLVLVVSDKVFVKKKTYQEVFKILEIVLLVITCLNLLLIVLGFASTFLKWRRFFYFIIVITWILTALTWAMFGLFLTIHNVADDTCLAVQEYLQDPKNTTLDALLPCADLATTSTQYLQVRKDMKDLINSASNQLLSYTNGSTSLKGICDPIGPAPNYDYTGICANDTLPISQLPSLVQPFVCNNTQSACLARSVNQTEYVEISAISKAGQSVLDTFPKIESLTNCSLVTNTLSILVQERCGPAKRAINHIWIAFVTLSSIMVLLIIFWCLANRRNTKQCYSAAILPQEQAIYSRPYVVMDK